MVVARKSKDIVARGATLYSGKKIKKTSIKDEKPKKIYSKKYDLNQEILPIYHSAPDPGFEDKVIEQLDRAGIEVGSYKKRYLIRRIRVRMGRLKLNSYREYFEFLSKNPKEIIELQESLSINVTRFFRNRDTFDLIKKEILPQMIKRTKKANRKEIKIWSAGCAVGAEPFTLAMICSDVVPKEIRVNIQATDIKQELLQMARNGVYNEAYLAEMTESEAVRYFARNNRDEYSVIPSIKRLVSFSRNDLMKDQYPSNLDLIICRNVLIYVDRRAQIEIITKFFEALKPGGILILGRTETLFGDWRKYVKIVSTKHRIYEKKALGLIESPTIQPKDEPRKKKAFSSETHKDRLSELRNFRKVSDKRKESWSERIEAHKATKKKVQLAEKRAFTKTRATRQESKYQRPKKPEVKRPFRRISATGIKKVKETSLQQSRPLSNHRNMLKKTVVPTKVSTIRRDFKSKSEKLEKLTPEEIYKKLKKEREAKRNKKINRN